MKPNGQSGEETSRWLLEQWAECFARAVESLTAERPAMRIEPCPAAGAQEGAIEWREQTFGGPGQLVVWVGAVGGAGRFLGGRIRDRGEGPDRYSEILNQCFLVFAEIWSGARGEPANCGSGRESSGPPTGVDISAVHVEFADGGAAELRIAFSPARAVEESERPSGAVPKRISKTLDVLLDVEMPVSVSFGRTEMPLRDLLKLGAGSFVELNRSIYDPVELIVNNRVVALGEVVVIEGNYGVRIQQIASREKRLWSGRPDRPD